MRIKTQDLIFLEVVQWQGILSRSEAERALHCFRTYPLEACHCGEAVLHYGGCKKLIKDAFRNRHQALTILDSGGFGMFGNRSMRSRNWRYQQMDRYKTPEVQY